MIDGYVAEYFYAWMDEKGAVGLIAEDLLSTEDLLAEAFAAGYDKCLEDHP